MLETSKNDILHRLKIARGHLEKVIKMVESEDYCLSVVQQSQAVESALKKVDELLLEHHLKTCVKDAIKSDRDVDSKVKEIIEVFRKSR